MCVCGGGISWEKCCGCRGSSVGVCGGGVQCAGDPWSPLVADAAECMDKFIEAQVSNTEPNAREISQLTGKQT